MLLTAIYSEEEADVTAVQILESAFPFRREPGGRDSSKGYPVTDVSQKAKGFRNGKKGSENVLTHENQEQRCSRAPLSQKCNSSTSNNQNQQSFSTLMFEACKKRRYTRVR